MHVVVNVLSVFVDVVVAVVAVDAVDVVNGFIVLVSAVVADIVVFTDVTSGCACNCNCCCWATS